MISRKMIVSILCGLSTAVVASAGAPATQGRDRAAERVQLAATEHVRILTELQTQLPPEAKADLTTALLAAQKGLDTAQAALTRVPPSTATASGTTPVAASTADAGTANVTSGKPTTVGLAKAREQVAASFATSTTTLQGVMTKVPAQAAARIQEALTKIEQNRAKALENLDRVIAMERPERPTKPDRPEHPDRPVAPEKPERPEHPGPPGL